MANKYVMKRNNANNIVVFKRDARNIGRRALEECLAVTGIIAGTVSVKNINRSEDLGFDFFELSDIPFSEYYTPDGATSAGTSQTQVIDVLNKVFSDSIQFHEIVGEYGAYVDSSADPQAATGTIQYPYNTIQDAVDNADDGDRVRVNGDFELTTAVILDPNKSVELIGTNNACIGYSTYSASNDKAFYQSVSSSTKSYKFENIKIHGSGDYGIYIRSASEVIVEDCEFTNNGWSGSGLNTVLDSGTSGVLGFDSSDIDLQAFYAGPEASNGGAMRIRSTTKVEITSCEVYNNLRGLRIQDCGVNGSGFITRNNVYQNIESGIYLASGSYDQASGCENFTVNNNGSYYNANNGVLVIGGINNVIALNQVKGNWNAGVMAWHCSNTRLRDMDLSDNNRSQYNGIGNTGDAASSIQISGGTIRAGADYIVDVLDTQVYNTGLGANTSRVGLQVSSNVSDINDRHTSLINIDDVGFKNQDYAVDILCDLDKVRLTLGDCRYIDTTEKNVKLTNGYYYELPFSNHHTNIKNLDISLDSTTSQIILKEGSTGDVLNVYAINTIHAIAFGSKIRIILKDSKKIQLEVDVANTSIEGSYVNAILNQALTQINGIFTNTVGFGSGSGGGDPVVSQALVGNDLTITLQSGTSYTTDVTSLAVDEDNFVVSGAVNGTNLELTMTDSSIITIDASNMINDSSLSASNDRWYISYGTNADTEVGAVTMDSTVNLQGPYYFGQSLNRGSEFKFNINTGNQLRLGIWDGPEAATAYNASPAMTDPLNWNTVFSFANGSGKFTNSSNTDISTYHASGYSATNTAPMSIRFGADGHLSLYDLSGGAEVLVGKTIIALATSSFKIQFGGFNNSVFPNGIISNSDFIWEIVHDFANTEAGVLNGILDHTVIQSGISISPGEKIMINLDRVSFGERFGTNYTGADTGITTAELDMERSFHYQTNEAIIGGGNWNHNTSAVGYITTGASLPSYRIGGAGAIQGMFSLRYITDNSLEVWSETNDELVMTALAAADGSPIYLHMGTQTAMTYANIPQISKQTIGQGSQPLVNFVPTVADQTVSVVEGEVLNFQIISSDNIVNQFVELDAPSWMYMNQVTGILSGTAPAFIGDANDIVLVNCKAGNAIGGSIDFTVTVTVQDDAAITNTKSLRLDSGDNSFLQGNPVDMNALERATNGDGSAWTISMWIKPSSSTANQTLLTYGAGNDVAGGAIRLIQTGGPHIVLTYGTTSAKIALVALNCLTVGSWNHLCVTFDGGTTGNVQADLADYYSRFVISVDGVAVSSSGSHLNNGFTGAISGANPSDNIFRIGRANNVYNNYAVDLVINQVALFDSVKSPSTIYALSAGDISGQIPSHVYNPESSIITITDEVGNADLTAYNFVSSDLVTDAP
tara:strand:- start:277 stop:4440 length:4164 start_codon:yes stop_codon:yes gene_type:complete